MKKIFSALLVLTLIERLHSSASARSPRSALGLMPTPVFVSLTARFVRTSMWTSSSTIAGKEVPMFERIPHEFRDSRHRARVFERPVVTHGVIVVTLVALLLVGISAASSERFAPQIEPTAAAQNKESG